MKTISEMTDLEAEKRLTELRGWCWHVPTECEKSLADKCKYCAYSMPYILANGFENKPYATSYDDIIPVIQGMGSPDGLSDDISHLHEIFRDTVGRDSRTFGYFTWLDFVDKTPRQLLNAVIEVLEAKNE